MKKILVLGTMIATLSFGGEWISDDKGCKHWNSSPGPNETITWSGKCKNGYANGTGTQQWYQDGKANGRYEGKIDGGNYIGFGTFYFASGDKYEGNWKSGKREGLGTEIFGNGEKYEGNWRSDNREGFGTYYFAEGTKYVGEWKQHTQDGFGTNYFADGTIWTGLWKGPNRILNCSSKQECMELSKNPCKAYYPGKTGRIKAWRTTTDKYIVRYVNPSHNSVTIEGLSSSGYSIGYGETREFSCTQLLGMER